MRDSLYRNSIYLMLNTACLSVLGFIFWIIAARRYTTVDVGIAATLIAASSIIALFSALGFDSAIIRHVAKTKNIKSISNTALTSTAIMSVLVSVIYVTILKITTKKYDFLDSSVLAVCLLIIFYVINVWNSLTNNLFIAIKRSEFILIINIVFGITRILLVLLLVNLGIKGLLISHALSISIALVLSLIAMRVIFNYSYSPKINLELLTKLRNYTSHSYLINTFSVLPTYFLPSVILITSGARYAAYFYIVTTITNGLVVIPQATSLSLFAEGAGDKDSLNASALKSVRFIIFMLLPAILILFLFGWFILGLFGNQYATNGYVLLLLLSIVSVPKSVNYVLMTLFRVRENLSKVSYIYTVYSFMVLFGAFIVLKLQLHMWWVGIVILLAEMIVLTYLFYFSKRYNYIN
ncbi:MAG TPA: oligosaccharide flippase family protein [Candidatus Sulfotelmatobacter sp.]|nr:oligosaccharide flippase family protein [Candidatus Sulfotelmatobacter sp.]